MKTAAGLEIRLLGGFDVVAGDRRVAASEWPLRRAADLVKLLALAPGHHLHREQVMDTLWPDREPAAAANNLYQAVHAARNALGRGGKQRWLELRAGVVSLEELDLWVDVDAFEAAAARAQAGDRNAVVEARALYRGELLPDDRYEDWPATRREALAESWRRLLTVEAEALETDGRIDDALACLRELLIGAEVDEDVTRELIRLEAKKGNRSAALRAFESLKQALREELDVDPSPETLALHSEILAGRLGPPVAPPRLDNLPLPLTTFVGRERQLADVQMLLRGSRLVTLTGTGGTGKTRLAVEAARQLVPVFAGGAWLVELAAVREPAGVVRATADAIGVREPAGGSLIDAIVGQVCRAETLLILDNCEHLVDACAELAAALLSRCEPLRILATSRQPLRIQGETVVRVPSLGVPDPSAAGVVDELLEADAVRLFVHRARAVDPAFRLGPENAADVAALCFHLDGLPLALELAASRVALLPVAVLAQRLPERFRLLVGGDRAALTRQQTLKATLDWSYQLLTAPQQRVLERLSVFAGGAALDAAEAVCAGPPVDASMVLPILGELVEQSLLVLDTSRDTPRYRQLETVREYGRERLAETGQADAVEAAHFRWAIELTAGADDAEIGETWMARFRRIGAELDNMRAALERSLVADAAVALQLANQLGSFWLWDMHLVEGRSWLEAALAAVPERTHLRADALLGLCAILGRAGETGEHARRATEALEITEELGDAAASANALQLLGISHWASDQLDEAVEDFSAAVESGRRGFPAGHAAALHALAATMWTRGDRVRARDLVEQALDATASLPESSPSLPPPIDIAFEIARTDRWTGRLELVMEENATHFRRMTRDAALSYLLGTRGTMARVEGDLEAARHDFDEALRAFRDHGDRRGEGAIEVRLGTLARDRGDATASREHLTRSLDIRRDLGDVRGVGVSEAVLGDLEISVGNLEVADRLLASCLDAARRRADPWTIRAALGNLASLALARGDAATATGLLEECLAVSRRTGRLRHTAWSQLRLAAVGRASGVDRAADVRAAAQAFELLGDAAGAAEAQALLDDPRPA